MATTEPVMMFISDLDIIDEEVKRRADFDINDKSRRKEVIQLRKEIIHDIVQSSAIANKNHKA